MLTAASLSRAGGRENSHLTEIRMKHVALLRGVNVGRNKQIPMARLRELMRELGFADATTVLRSGNIVFTGGRVPPERLGERIEDAIAGEFGSPVSVLIRTGTELAAIVERNPLAGTATDGSRYLVAFLSAPPPPAAVRALDPAGFAPDEFRFAGREIYLWHPNGISNSTLDKRFWNAIPAPWTARNWNTVTKLLSMSSSDR